MMTLQTYIMMYTPQRYPLTMKICCMNQNSIINFFFIKGYIVKKMANCILVDDGSAINILPLKTKKELRIPMENSSQVI
jgi:hypothetical protein